MQTIWLNFCIFICQVSLKEKNPSSIARYDAFRLSRKVIERKARVARMGGKGKVPYKARSLSGAEENILWESGQLGYLDPW